MIIGTHDGTFHADDVCAVALLLRLYPDAIVIRTRDKAKLESAKIRVDVGMKYDPPTDFDHHQADFNFCRASGVPYAACGLVALHHKDILFPSLEVWEKLDSSLFATVDAQDNGLETAKAINGFALYDLSKIIASFRPSARHTRWMQPADIAQVYYDAFMGAVNLAQGLISREIRRTQAWLLDQEGVGKLVEQQKDSSVIVMPFYAPWQEQVVLNAPQAEVIVFPDERSQSWVAQTVPDKIGGPSPPLFPADWAGKRDEDLVEISGIESAVFCHRSQFLCVASTKEGALEMADRAISN